MALAFLLLSSMHSAMHVNTSFSSWARMLFCFASLLDFLFALPPETRYSLHSQCTVTPWCIPARAEEHFDRPKISPCLTIWARCFGHFHSFAPAKWIQGYSQAEHETQTEMPNMIWVIDINGCRQQQSSTSCLAKSGLGLNVCSVTPVFILWVYSFGQAHTALCPS